MSYTPDPEELEADEKRDRLQYRLQVAVLGLVVLVVLGVTALNIFRFQDSATLRAQQSTQERSDCVRRINDDRTIMRDERDNLQSQVIVAALTPPYDPARVVILNSQLTLKVNELKALPPLQKQVDKDCPSV